MPFTANIIRILIASPGDIGEERDIIPEVIHEWNAMNAHQTKHLLMPVKWETHSAPLMGNRPQEIINRQIVVDCDMLVGIFWTRIGTNTGVSISGTAEEIEQFVGLKKPIMLYFSQSLVDPDKIEIEQLNILRNFKEKMRLKGLIENYAGIYDLRQKFARQLGINVSNIINERHLHLEESVEITIAEKQSDKQKNKKATISNQVHKAEKNLSLSEVDDYLIKAVESVSEENGWAKLASVGVYLLTYTPVDFRKFGHFKLMPFLQSRSLFEFRTVSEHPQVRILKK